MSKKWLNKKLCSFGDDKVRIELGPQIIELDCTDKNLSNDVTSPHYQIGKKDAFGKIIGSDKKMNCVDWRAKHVPELWKVYKMQETGELDNGTGKIALNKDGDPVQRFIKVNEFESVTEATTFAGGLI